MDNKLLILLVIALMIYTYVTCYSGSATELFSLALGSVNNPNVVSGNTPEGKAIILEEAKGSWHKSCNVESADWNSSLNKLKARCSKKKGAGTIYNITSVVCPNRKFKNVKAKLKCE